MTHHARNPRAVARRMLAAFLRAYPQYATAASRATREALPVGAFVNAWGWTWGKWAGEGRGNR